MMEPQAKYIPKTRQDWQQKRKEFIGASEIPTILGLNPYKSPYQLWLEKTQRETPDEENQHTRRGQLLEQAVADYFEKDTGSRIIKSSAKDVIYIHKEHPFIGGTPDRFYYPKEKDGKRVLECKTTMKQVDEIPLPWYVQLQVYLGLTGTDQGAIAWLSSHFGFKFGNVSLDFDDSTYALAIQAAVNFYTEYWQKDMPPKATTVADVQKMFRQHSEGKLKEVNSDMYEKHRRLAMLKQEANELDGQIKSIEEEIKLQYADFEGMTYGGEVISTWKTTKEIKKFDKAGFQKQHPDIYNQFVKVEPGQRRFLIKI